MPSNEFEKDEWEVPAALEEMCKEGGAWGARGKLGDDNIQLAEGNGVFYADDAAHSTPCTSLI